MNKTNFNYINEFILESKIVEENLVSDQDVLESIEKEYFHVEEKIDTCKLELCRIPITVVSKDISIRCKLLIKQHCVVSKKVLLLVLQKQSKYKEIFNKIVQIQKHLSVTVKTSKICRNHLKLATNQFVSSSLQILYHFRKQKHLETLLNILYRIKQLCETKNKLKHFLNEENYPKVISLISECQKASLIYNKYHCIVSLYSNLNDILEQVEENLDLSLSKICINFNVDHYASIQIAYNFLGKSQTAMDQLHMHFTAAVHNTALKSVIKYSQDEKKQQFNYICKAIALSNFLPCLIEICRSLLVILQSYYFTIKWHNGKYFENNKNEYFTTNYNHVYVIDKLENGIIKVFNEIENKIKIYLDGFDFLTLTFEEFVQVLIIIYRMSKIGNKICGRNITKLYEGTKDKIINYFYFYHNSRLDELKIFLENDGWKLCPIKSTFNITQLLEFKTFKYICNSSQSKTNFHENIHESSNYESNDWIQDFVDGIVSPFNIIVDESAKEDFFRTSEDCLLKNLYDSDDEISEDLKYDFVDESNRESRLKKKRKHVGPIITNTTLSVLRICGKYLQVTRLFKEVTNIVIQHIIQIFELYLYAVYSFFAVDLQLNNDLNTIYSTNLKRTISRIKDNLIITNTDSTSTKSSYSKIYQPHLSSIIDLNDSNKLYGMLERLNAVESLIFLGQQYESLKFYLESIVIDEEEQIYLNEFYLHTIHSTIELRKPIYMSAISRSIDVTNILILMNKVDWELKDVTSQHSKYVDYCIQEIVTFKMKLTDIQKYELSKDIYESIWDTLAYLVTHTLVEGFSNAKKCSNGGRALMQLDFTQFISMFETITLLRPMPYQEYVASYIKAFYLPDATMESWIKIHTEYSSKHIVGLVSCMYQNKKVKQRLLTLIEDQRLNR